METNGFDTDAVRQAFRQSGLPGLLQDADAEQLEAALSALGQRLGEIEKLQVPEVSAETLRGWADRLVRLFDDFERPGEIIGNSATFALTWAWWVTVNRQAKAILCLYDAGLGADTAPLVRSMIEHCLWSVALARDDGPLLATILREADEQRKKMTKAASGGLLELPAELAALFNAGPPVPGEGSPIKSFAAVCRELGVTDTIGVIWRVLSSLSHPTNTTAFFLTQPGIEGVKISKTPALPGLDPAGLGDQAIALTVDCLLWAGFAIDRLMTGHPLHASLQAVAEEAHVKDLSEQRPRLPGQRDTSARLR
jgi:hypothetical protein